jgi:dephospho-CoA kinase
LKEPGVKAEIRRSFGDDVFEPGGEVDRRRLGRLVFGLGEAERSARARLEGIVHPLITEALVQEIAKARARPDVEAIILDAAILLETNWRSQCDLIVFVDAPFEERLARVRAGRGWTADELRAREASQLSLDEKRSRANMSFSNFGPKESISHQLDVLWSRVMSVLPHRRPFPV